MMNFYPFLNKQTYFWKWGLVAFGVWIGMGSNFCYDVPTALHNSMQVYFSDSINEDQFEVYYSGLFSLCAFANIFLPFINGRLRDKIGDRIVLLGLVSLILLGQCIFTYGMMIKSFIIIYAGRIVASWGIESIGSTQIAFVSPYFKQDHVGFVAGLNELFSTFGSISVLYLCPKIALQYGIVMAVFSGAIINVFSMVCTSICVVFDKDADNDMLENQDYSAIRYQSILNNPNQAEVDQDLSLPLIQQVKQLGPLYWLVAVFNFLIYNSVMGFSNVSVAFLTERFDQTESQASELVAMMWLGNALISPILGSIVDKYGHRAILSIFTAIICTTGQIMIWYEYPIISLILIGLSLSCAFQAAWASIVNIVRPDALGKAYALTISVSNFGAAITPLVVGILRANTGDYFYSQVFLGTLGAVALVFSLIIYKFDKSLMLDGLSA